MSTEETSSTLLSSLTSFRHIDRYYKQPRENGKKSRHADDIAHYHHLLSDFISTVSAAKSAFYLSKIDSSASNPEKLFSLFSSFLTPLPPSSHTADDFATDFTKNVKDINSSFTPMPIQKARPQNNLLDPNQSGFRTGRSTEMVLLTVTQSLGAARASSNSSALILLYLSSVFDTVNYQIFLSSLAELGIADSVLTWFTSYLTNRTFQVEWNGSLSKPCCLETGVPQGSVGPLLFSLYTRSLRSAVT